MSQAIRSVCWKENPDLYDDIISFDCLFYVPKLTKLGTTHTLLSKLPT